MPKGRENYTLLRTVAAYYEINHFTGISSGDALVFSIYENEVLKEVMNTMRKIGYESIEMSDTIGINNLSNKNYMEFYFKTIKLNSLCKKSYASDDYRYIYMPTDEMYDAARIIQSMATVGINYCQLNCCSLGRTRAEELYGKIPTPNLVTLFSPNGNNRVLDIEYDFVLSNIDYINKCIELLEQLNVSVEGKNEKLLCFTSSNQYKKGII